MCRWFAYVSTTEECLLEDVLITPAHALSKQVQDHYLPKLLSHHPDQITTEHEISARNRLLNVDGFGLAWYTSAASSFTSISGLRPALYKTAQPPLHDLNFRSICANTSTLAVFAHIRAATDTPIVSVNNHPFAFGRHVFMHNGVVSNFLAIRRELCKLLDDECYANVMGSTDSEHLAALYMMYLSKGKGRESWEMQYPVEQMRDALVQAAQTVIRLQREKLGSKAAANSLNLAASDGVRLVAMRFRNHAVEQPPSLYYSTRAGVTLNSRFPDHPNGKEFEIGGQKAKPEEHGRHVIVASEPSTYRGKDWELIEKNHCVMAAEDGELQVEKVEYPKDLNSTVNSLAPKADAP